MTDLEKLKNDLFQYVRIRLGEGIIDIELDPIHFEVAFDKAVGTYRQRSSGAYEESYSLLELNKEQSVYTLPTEVSQVRQVFRRNIGDSVGPYSSSFDPFSQASLNVYLMNYSYSGGLATYELYAGYVELAARMFGGFMNYTFNPVTKELRLIRDIKGDGEVVLLWTYNAKPAVSLLTDPMISQWIRDYTYAVAKQIIGESREKFSNFAGPNGGSALNGPQLKAEALAEMDKLVEELRLFVDGYGGYGFILG